ncbi:MAG: hypothetical protein ABMA01_19335 [Chthoniobacteraceae bacterium]
MNDATTSPDAALRRGRRIPIVCALSTGFSILLLTAIAFLAVQDLTTHYNLYYLLWKAGIRSYERPVAFGGLLHDHIYRKRFIGMTIAQIEHAFPNTFYKVRKQPPIAKPNQEFYIDDYQQAQREEGGYGFCWQAIFEDGRLSELNVFKN